MSTLGRRAFRGQLTDGDLARLMDFYRRGHTERGFEGGIQLALQRILASPKFVWRVERDPVDVAAGKSYRLSDAELASRLSFFLWSSIPDDQLLEAARQGRLRQPAVLDEQVRRMLADPKIERFVTNFAGQWLYLRNLKNQIPDSVGFPNFDDNLRQAFLRETELFVGSIVRENRSVIDLMTADYTFVNERLAKHYGYPNIYGSQFRRVTHPNDLRRGLLGQGSVLMVTSHADRTSPVVRGKWILDNLLGAPPPLPPMNVPPLPDDERSGTAARAVGAREDREAPGQRGLRELPQDHGPDRPGARELRRGGSLPRARRPVAQHGGHADRRVGPADGRDAGGRRGHAAQGAAEGPGDFRRRAHREAPDLRDGARRRLLRHADGARHRARRQARQLCVCVARVRESCGARRSRCG